MKVMIKERSMSTSAGLLRQGDVAVLPDEEIKKVMKLKPGAFEILPAEPVFKKAAPAKKTQKRARNANGTLKADNPATPENEAWTDA